MTDYLFFLLLGTGAGAIIAAFGLGLVITYQGSGVVNFAYGTMATWSAYVYADLRQGNYTFPIPGLPARYHFGGDVGLAWAMALALLTAAGMGLVVYQFVFRPLLRAPGLAKIVASIGLVIVFTALIERRFPDNAGLRVDAILPVEPVTFADGVTVPRDGLSARSGRRARHRGLLPRLEVHAARSRNRAPPPATRRERSCSATHRARSPERASSSPRWSAR